MQNIADNIWMFFAGIVCSDSISLCSSRYIMHADWPILGIIRNVRGPITSL